MSFSRKKGKKELLRGEISNEIISSDVVKVFEIEVINVNIDTLLSSPESLFNSLFNEFYADITLLDPKNFNTLN